MMEKHKCKLCFRNFSNGRALGGHMRSHVMNLKANESPPPTIQLSFEAESSSTPSSSSGEDEDNKNLCYGLRENPKRSFRVADPEFSFAAAGGGGAAVDTGSVILQDRESETESSRNVTRRRSKREWKLDEFSEKMKLSRHGNNRNESESSASDITTEEDVAFCLMLLSRDSSSPPRDRKWNQKRKIRTEEEEEQEDDDPDSDPDLDLDLEDEEEEEEEDEEGGEEEESEEYEEITKNKTKTNKVRGGRYKCETCNKVFRSYQALGGHRASHKKIRLENQRQNHETEITMDHDYDENNNHNHNHNAPAMMMMMMENRNSNSNNSNNLTSNTKKIHECPVCFRVFASGQALGGHKRTHVITTVPSATTRAAAAAVAVAVAVANSNVASSSTKLGRESTMIDLNLPAPVDDDDVSQFEDSAASDAECFKPVVKVLPR